VIAYVLPDDEPRDPVPGGRELLQSRSGGRPGSGAERGHRPGTAEVLGRVGRAACRAKTGADASFARLDAVSDVAGRVRELLAEARARPPHAAPPPQPPSARRACAARRHAPAPMRPPTYRGSWQWD